MPDLESFHARVCPTACAFIIYRQKILLVKHKKLGIWLAPGGHIEPHEPPHQAALREALEETGIKGEVISATPIHKGIDSQYLPLPFALNLHWISKENYQARNNSLDTQKPYATKTWPKGCEQHLVYCYLVKPIGNLEYTQNLEETDAIGWFTPGQVTSLETTNDIKSEIALAFSISNA